MHLATYMKSRGEALAKVVDYFDTIIDMHPQISQKTMEVFGRKSLTIFPKFGDLPEMEILKNDPCLKMFATGLHTGYRMGVYNSLISSKFGSDSFLPLEVVGFVSDQEFVANACFSLNVPQSESWPISSPARIYRAIQIGVIPVSYKKFQDHPIERCSIFIEDLDNITCVNDLKMLANRVSKEILDYGLKGVVQNNLIVEQFLDSQNDLIEFKNTQSLEF